MKLDFVMKLFLALIVVFFVIISVYYTANGLAKIFGINNFKIKKPGLYSGNLALLGIKNTTKIFIGTANYSDCLSYCKNDPYEPHLFGNCEDQCSFICNQTNGCINITGRFRIATLGETATFKFKKRGTVIDSETFNDLPEVTYITHTFFLPKGTTDSKTNLTCETSETSGIIKIGNTKAIKMIKYGDYCNKPFSHCSIFKENLTYYLNNELNSTTSSNDFDNIKDCRSISIDLKSNCTFPISIAETEKGETIGTFQFDDNGTYSLYCPITTNSITLSSNLEDCYVKYNLTVSKGLVENDSIRCYNQSITVEGNTRYICNCSTSGSACS